MHSKYRKIHKFDYAVLSCFFQTWGSEESIIANGSFCMTISDKWIAKEKALILQIFATFTRKVDRDWEVETNSWTSIRKNLLSPNL